ncbi:MAG: hypothetical protein ACE5R6_21105 [Candidatus Heimdallarchaeota archaeon]
MPNKGLTLKLTKTTLKSLNLQLIRVTYSKRITTPYVCLPSSILPFVFPFTKVYKLTMTRYLLVRPEEIPEIENRVKSLEKDIQLPSHCVLKVEKHGDRNYIVLETQTNLKKDAKFLFTRCALTKKAVEILIKLPRVAAICTIVGNTY